MPKNPFQECVEGGFSTRCIEKKFDAAMFLNALSLHDMKNACSFLIAQDSFLIVLC